MNSPVDVLKRPLPEALLSALQARFGAQLSTTHAMREHHGRDESSYDPMLPDAVVQALVTHRYDFEQIPEGAQALARGEITGRAIALA